MGNQLVGIAPSQIFPVEHYLTDNLDIHFNKNLGSTRFFKVARAQSREGLVVVKVFVIHDPTLPLTSHRTRIEEIRTKLSSAVNCLTFRKTVLTDKAAYLIREYVKYNLYDRISTRPFLTLTEKKWIAFQILYALHQCHKVGVSHGDIKLENILVTSWHWVLLSDFASYKPTYLPDDNPSDFSFFFDTSGRRSCYIAPERFHGSLNTESYHQLLILSEDSAKKEELTPSMDIFSTGCVLAEMFLDGRPPFDLSQLLTYRNSESECVPPFLNEIEDVAIRDLITAMINKDPSKRLTAELYLAQERGRIFPEYFYTFLQSYMLIFSSSPILSPDEKIDRLRKDIVHIINLLKSSASSDNNDVIEDTSEVKDCEALILIVTLVTSCIRGLHMSSSKLQALEILFHITQHTAVEIILDRILPYMLHLLHDDCPRVKVSAIHTVNKCLSAVCSVPLSDANIFPEYVLPALIPMAHDEAVVVRVALAETIAQTSETALKFLEYSQKATLENNEIPCHSYESELATLHEMIQQCVLSLLTDVQNIVKRTLIESGIVKLCIFFGKYKANDLLLSHMITFLNDKDDKQLRGSFFDCIGGVAGYIGIHCSSILTPLLQQGFTDSEEFVARKAINAMSSLTQSGLLHKTSLYELLSNTACFLVHPNLWIRQAVVGFVSTLVFILSTVDVQCRVIPTINPFLKYPVIQVEKQVLLLNALKDPIPRVVYDSTVKYNDFELFMKTLCERQQARKININHTPSMTCIPTSGKQNSSFHNFFRRLCSEGMSEVVEDQLLLMLDHLKKLNKYYMSTDLQQTKSTGKIDVSNLQHRIKYYTANFAKNANKDVGSITSLNKKRTAIVEDLSINSNTSMNEEWKHMFGSADLSHKLCHLSPDNFHEHDSVKKNFGLSSNEGSFDADSLQERSYIQYRYPPCRLELSKLIQRKQEQYEITIRKQEWVEDEAWLPCFPSSNWKFKSSLVAHVHEHKASVNRLVPIPHTVLFASCSSDSCIRLWDCAKMEGQNIANRSRQIYNSRSGSLNSMTICRNNQSLAAVSSRGDVMVMNVDMGSSKMTVLQNRQLDLQEEGCAVDIAYFDPGSQAVLVYVTMYGCIIGWDLRACGNAWKIDNKLKQGVVTTMCMDSFQNCLIIGTGCGYHTCFDLRFRLPITSVVHPYSSRVRRIIRHPKESSWIISAVQGNNEVSVWNLETGFQQLCLWAGDTPPLTKPRENKRNVCALYAYNSDNGAVLLTGGTDQRVRKWNLKPHYDECQVAIPAANDVNKNTTYSYEDRLIDGTRVVQEHSHVSVLKERSSDSSFSSGNGSSDKQLNVNESLQQGSVGPEQPASGHRDTITDITVCKSNQYFLLTSSRDGVIKVWK